MNYNKDPRRQENGYDPFGSPQVKRRYTPEEAGHEKHRRPVKRNSFNRLRRKKISINPAVVIVTLLFALIAGLCIFLIVTGKNRTEPADTPIPQTPDETTEAVTTEDPLPYFTMELSYEDIHKGNLILVNSYNDYIFPDEMEEDIVKIKDHKNDHYGVSSYTTSVEVSKTLLDVFNTLTEDYYNETGFEYLQINSAYRSKGAQEDLYAQYEKDYGADYAAKYVAKPGQSEHHTGLGVDLNVNRGGAITYVESDEGCEWFREKCQEYGFILRYPKDKVHLTGISFESWHYRYVGTPHAQIMEDLNLCLEEYTDYVKSYEYDGICLGYSEETGAFDMTSDEFLENGGTMIYYVEAIEGEKTAVIIPKDCEYTISGNNVDGFVITCKK